MQDCLFCKIVSKEIPKDFVYEDKEFCAFNDIHPRAPVHILIIPKQHVADTLNEVTSEQENLLGKWVLAATHIAKKMRISERGYRLIVNCGEDGGQVIQHLHLHILGGKKMGPKGEEI